MTASTRFVVLSTQRSGSTWLLDVLGKLPGTRVYGELLLEQTRTWDVGATDFPRLHDAPDYRRRRRPRRVFAYLDALYRQDGVVGFKLMYSQVQHYPETLAYLRLRRIRVVHLVRRNYLDVVISREMKRLSGRPHLLQGGAVVHAGDGVQVRPDAEPAPRQVTLDPGALLRELRRSDRKYRLFRAWLRWSRQPHLEVAYEDLVRRPAAFEAVRSFLGMEAGGVLPEADLKKITRGGHADVIRNYEAVRAALERSPFAHLLRQADTP